MAKLHKRYYLVKTLRYTPCRSGGLPPPQRTIRTSGANKNGRGKPLPYKIADRLKSNISPILRNLQK